jgi:hypothetical protein
MAVKVCLFSNTPRRGQFGKSLFARDCVVGLVSISLLHGRRPVTGGITRVDSLEKVIEKLATTEKTTLAIAREEGGKIRVTSGSWDGERVILKGQVLEVRNSTGGCMSPERPLVRRGLYFLAPGASGFR